MKAVPKQDDLIVKTILDWLDTLSGKYDFLLAEERRLIPPNILFELCNHGLFGLQIDKKYGGLDLSFSDAAKVIEKLASINLSLATIVTTHANGIYPILHYGTEKLKEKYLQHLSQGRGLAAFALTEEGAGSYVNALETKAESLGNNNWLVAGKKIWVDSGAWASMVITFCKISSSLGAQQKFIALAIPTDTKGVAIEEESYTMGLKTMVQNQISFDQVIVTADEVLGSGDDGLFIANETLDRSRLLMSIKSLGASKRCLQLLINYAKNRKISTGILFDNPVTTNAIGDISLSISILEIVSNKLIQLFDEKHTIPSEILMMLKVFGSELANYAADRTMQVLGGRGYMEQNVVAQIFRDARSFKISEGSNEALNSHVGSVLIYAGEEIYSFFARELNNPDNMEKLKDLINNIYNEYILVDDSVIANTNQYWAFYLLGKLATYQFFLCVIEASQNLEEAQKALFIQYLDYQVNDILAEFDKKSKANLLLKSTDLIRLIANTHISKLNNLDAKCLRVENKIDVLLTNSNSHKDRLSILHGDVNLYKQVVLKSSNFAELVMLDFDKYKDRTALVCLDESITYAQLLSQVDIVANILLAQGISSGDVIGVFIEHSILLVVTLLSILKVGATYIPLDTNYPETRLKHIFDDSEIKFAVTTSNFVKLVKKYVKSVIAVSMDLNKKIEKEVKFCESKLAYIIYTSGSSGKPKGVKINHSAVINFLLSMQHKMLVTENDIFLMHTTISFDIAVLEIFLPLLVGAKLVIVPYKLRYDSKKLIDYIESHSISVLQATPSFWHMLIEYGWKGNNKLKAISGGELLYPTLAKQISDISKELWNMYGPTEATIWASAYSIMHIDDNKNIPIGTPLDNLDFYIIDDEGLVVNKGKSGEICISGIGLADGYVNRPDLDQEKFVELKLDESKVLIYKTGDIGVINDDGELICLGRNDRQVKYNGHRIELGEIEQVLLLHDEVKSVAVVKIKDDNNLEWLVAYITSNSENVEDAKLRNHLKQYLPEYMIPSIYAKLEQMPLTHNYKIDYKALPKVISQKNDLLQKEHGEKSYNSNSSPVMEIWQSLFKNTEINEQSNFFELGGNSLLALRIISKLRDQLKYNLTIAELYQHPTILEINKLINKVDDGQINNLQVINKYEILNVEEQKLSFAQERIWFIDSLESGTMVYNIPIILQLTKDTKLEYISKAILAIINRHEVLRSVIHQDKDSNLYQEIISIDMDSLIQTYDYDNENDLNLKLKQAIQYTFKLGQEIPIKVTVYQQKKHNSSIMILILIHHIAGDGWSIDVLTEEVNILYQYYCQLETDSNLPFPLPNLSIQYKDYALWQREFLGGEILEKQLLYWQNELLGYEKLNLITDNPRPAIMDYSGSTIEFKIDEITSTKLYKIAKDLGISLYSVLLGGYCLLLHAYTNQTDIVVGTPVANRHHDKVDNLIGFFVNMLALRFNIDGEQIITDYLLDIGKKVVLAQIHQDLPFEQLVNALNVEKDRSHSPIFQTVFGIQNFGNGDSDKKQLFTTHTDSALHEIARFDLTLMIDDSQNELIGSFNYKTSLYNKETILRLVKTYTTLLTNLASIDRNKKLSYLELIDQDEKQFLIYECNQTIKTYPLDKIIHQLFEAQVTQTPNDIAIICEAKRLTYKELNELANQLAHYLRKTHHIKGDDLIALCLDRSEYMLIAILGVLKAGGAYVPMDPNYPDERIGYILEDTNAKVILANECYKDKIASSLNPHIHGNDKLVLIDDAKLQNKLKKGSTVNLKVNITSKNLAYVIYTSGTTGKPKGVMIEHISAVNYLLNIQTKIFAGEDITNIDFSTSIGFDFSVTNTLGVICSGKKICIFTGDPHNLDAYKDHLLKNEVNFVKLVPSYFELLLENLNVTKINKVLLGGEKLSNSIIEKVSKNNFTVYDEYGPTETTVGSNLFCAYVNGKSSTLLTLGEIYHNYKNYVLDSNKNLLPVGAVGELYIGGIGLARGYLNRSELTEERFIANPFQTKAEKQENKNARIYKTGDLVRYLPNGNLEYIGRNDQQVKIRGYRIELGEIELTLNNYPGISQSVVIATNLQSLVGYYVSRDKLNSDTILAYLQAHLPDYMVPNVLLHLEKLPLTINGKLDKKALPDPEFKSLQTEYIAPTTKDELLICEVWQDVLKLEKVGCTDNFFSLGGNSILAIKVAHKLSNKLNVLITVADIFKYKTIACLSKSIGGNIEQIVIPRANLARYSLSFAEERLWFIEQYTGGTNAYHYPLLLEILEETKVDNLKQALTAIVKRHEMLRSIIVQGEGENGYRKICNEELIITEKICENEVKFKLELGKDINTPFNLQEEYPIRACLYDLLYEKDELFSNVELSTKLNSTNKDGDKLSNGETNVLKKYLLINIHHIASDGWSIDILQQELLSYYEYYAKNKPLNLVDLTIQYKDFAVWQREYLSGVKLEEQLTYWKQRLAGYENLQLATDRVRPKEIDYNGEDIKFTINKKTSHELRELAKEYGVTLYALLLTGFYILLNKYSSQTNIVIGTPIANRHYEQIKDLIGLFINSLALREEIDINRTGLVLLKQVQNHLIEIQEYQDLPFEILINELDVEKDLSRHPIFQVMFSVQSFGKVNGGSKYFKIANQEVESEYKIAKYDITLFIDDSENELEASLNYRTSLYDAITIERLAEHYAILLEMLPRVLATQKISEYNILSEEEYQQLIYDYNQTYANYPEEKTIHELFEEQVAKTPDSIAIVYEDIQLTYKELNEGANQLANYLREIYQIKGDDLIALCLDRSEYMLIAILAVLKSGGAYVPLDPSYSDDRIQYVLEDASTKIILTSDLYFDKLKRINLNIKKNISIEVIDRPAVQTKLSLYARNNLEHMAHSRNLAYVIYTSGTTGKPKGVMIENRSVVNYLYNVLTRVFKSQQEIVDFSTNIGFDLTVTTTLGALCSGSKICIYAKDVQELEDYKKHLIRHKISFAKLVPSYFGLILDDISETSLKKVMLGGEKVYTTLLNKLKRCDFILYDEYGPTEATVGSCLSSIYENNLILTEVGIGKAYANYKLYVLDNNLLPSPKGVVGELYIGGSGLARGYLNRLELTEERFVANPFQSEDDKKQNKNERLYKTGDLVRYLADGNLEYIGRNDFQVKIRGYRIELGEVESKLSSCPGVKQSVVLAKEHQSNMTEAMGGNKYLVGYYVADDKINEDEINTYLSNELPEYMIPSVFVSLEKLPLTINGKLDKNALPEPSFLDESNYLAPRNELEAKVCEIYTEVLGLDESKLGIKDDFFRMGGDSIISIQLVSRLRQRLGLNVSVKDIFNNKTILKLYNNVISKKSFETKLEIISENGVLNGNVPLLPIQEWFWDNVNNGLYAKAEYWNQSFLIHTPKLDLNILRASLVKLIEYHDGFRLNYRVTGKVEQYYNNCEQLIEIIKHSLDLHYLDVTNLKSKEGSVKFTNKINEVLTSWQNKFDLYNGSSLYSVGYIDGYSDGSSRVFFALHHLIVDTVSWRIITEDLGRLYTKLEEAKAANELEYLLAQNSTELLGAKGTSYRQWIKVVKDYAINNEIERSYWETQLKNSSISQSYLESLITAGDKTSYCVFEINEEITNNLLTKSNEAYHTQINDLLLSAFGLALSKLTKENANYITLEGHGREELIYTVDITKTVGWFTSMYPVCLEVDTSNIFKTLIHVKNNLRLIPNKGIGYGSLFGYSDKLPKISFNYLGQLDQDSGTWSLSGDSSGDSYSRENKDYHIINVNGLIQDGKLSFSIASKLSQENVDDLAQEFKSKLEEIVEYTTNQSRSYLTASDVNNIISQDYLEEIQKDVEISGVYRANSLQQGFIYHALHNDLDTAYRVQIIFKYENKLEVGYLKDAWQLAVNKYPSLRLRFAWEGELVQIIDKHQNIDWTYIDISKTKDKLSRIDEILKTDRKNGYALQRGNLLRIYLIKETADRYVCIMSSHHAILDGWSNPLLLEFVHEAYLQLKNKKQVRFEIEEAYANTQNYLQGNRLYAEEYWKEQLSQIEEYGGSYQ